MTVWQEATGKKMTKKIDKRVKVVRRKSEQDFEMENIKVYKNTINKYEAKSNERQAERDVSGHFSETDACAPLNGIFDGWERNEIVHFELFLLTYLKLCIQWQK